jgi:outer membrane receptor for ferrienterochelin and colicin
MGVLGTYDATKNLSISAGWTTGEDSSYANPNNNKAVLTGFTYSLSDDATVYYWLNAGKAYHDAVDYFIQSVCFEWDLTKRFTYVLQYNLRNDSSEEGNASAYGVNNHFLYKLNDQWGVGTRFEWLRNNGGYFANAEGEPFMGDFYQVTLGLNWNPRSNVSIRPEIRYDWCDGAKPFGPSDTFGGYSSAGERSYQFSGGCGVVVTF